MKGKFRTTTPTSQEHQEEETKEIFRQAKFKGKKMWLWLFLFFLFFFNNEGAIFRILISFTINSSNIYSDPTMCQAMRSNSSNNSSPHKCVHALITIFHIILGAKSSLVYNLLYFYYSSPVLTGMTWQKQDYFFPN